VIAVAVVAAGRLHGAGVLILLPAWLIASTAFWLLVPSLLIHRRIGWRDLLPGALLASIVLGGTIATSPLFLAAPLNQNGKAFGSFGVVLTTLGYVFIMITLSLVCAVFSPVWIHWRGTEKRRDHDPATAPEEPVL
jgi:membrane protein